MKKIFVFIIVLMVFYNNFLFSGEIKLAKIDKKSYRYKSDIHTILKRYKNKKKHYKKHYGKKSYKHYKRYKYSKNFIKPLSGYIYKDSKHKGVYIKPLNYDKGVKAAQEGKVIYADFLKYFGNVIIIRHKNGYKTIYAFLNKLYVSKNSYVRKGDYIANFHKSHPIYFEIRKNCKCFNALRTYKRLLNNG